MKLSLSFQNYLFLIGFLLNLNACNYFLPKTSDSTEVPPVTDYKLSELNYSNVYEQVIRANCVSCHGTSGGVSLESYELTKSHLQKIYETVFVQKSMPKPPTSPLKAQQLGLLNAWIRAGAPETSAGEPLPPSAPPLGPNFESIRHHILEVKCLQCHAPGKPVARIPLVTKADILNSPLELAIPGNPDESGLVLAIIEEDPRKIMPPPKDAQGNLTGLTRLSALEIQAIYDWIQNGAKD